jgi:exopolyphosphatase/guanosine-5'-triphosphate,3'-diphosphate pyrophosphatase
MIRAGIDIGTNTILLLVAEVEDGRVTRVLEDQVRVVRLGKGVDQARAFQPDAMERARACFHDYAAALKKYSGIEVRAVATSGSRDAKNSPEFFAQMERETGIHIRVISGEEEALLSFRGALPDETPDPLKFAVLDIGGGSTEVVGLERAGSESLFRFSFNMGCVRLTERFLPSDPPEPAELAQLRAFVREGLAEQREILGGLRGRELVGVAGTATYLAAAALGLTQFDPDKIQGARISLAQVRQLREEFSGLTAEKRLGIGGMDRGRADVIVGGAIILEEVLAAAGLEGFTASVRGLRYGAVLL